MVQKPRPVVNIVCVGAIFIDTICTVSTFPEPDTKTRAESVKKRRGGNVGNTLQVLSDILAFSAPDPIETKLPRTKLYLLAPLPETTSADGALIAGSLPDVDLLNTSSVECESAPSSMVIQARNGPTQGMSRTIISHPGALPEMTLSDFKAKIPLWNDHQNGDAVSRWIHFEGRNPITTHNCIAHLRNTQLDVHISIECEHPQRSKLMESAQLADVVFFSKLWAEAEGFETPQAFLQNVANIWTFDREQVNVVCTWGAEGAAAVRIGNTTDRPRVILETVIEPAWKPLGLNTTTVVDTIGAGDTFIAGMLYKLTNHPEDSLQHMMAFAAEVAGRKVYREGFGGLGREMWPASMRVW